VSFSAGAGDFACEALNEDGVRCCCSCWTAVDGGVDVVEGRESGGANTSARVLH
jgi:hypothetical protein